MKRKKLTQALIILGMVTFAAAPFLQPSNHEQAAAYAMAAAGDDDDDFNGIRFKLFFPNDPATP